MEIALNKWVQISNLFNLKKYSNKIKLIYTKLLECYSSTHQDEILV